MKETIQNGPHATPVPVLSFCRRGDTAYFRRVHLVGYRQNDKFDISKPIESVSDITSVIEKRGLRMKCSMCNTSGHNPDRDDPGCFAWRLVSYVIEILGRGVSLCRKRNQVFVAINPVSIVEVTQTRLSRVAS